MSKLTFYQAELRPVDACELNSLTRGLPIEERIGECPECDGTEWWIYPRRSAHVVQGGKLYCDCLNCGYNTHL